MTLSRIEEFQLTDQQQDEIHQLLHICFEGYPAGRTYFKQLPNFRYLAYHNDQLVGHLAVEHRMMALNQTPTRVFGVVDICVHPDFRHRQIASTLLKKLEELGKNHQIDFIVLTGTDHDFYKKMGYDLHTNTCRWLLINDHQTLGVHHRQLQDCILVKSLGTKKWSEGVVDFLGAVF